MITVTVLGLRQTAFDMHLDFLLVERFLFHVFLGLLQEFLLLNELLFVDTA